MARHAEALPLFGQDEPDIRVLVPRASAVIAEHRFHGKARAFKAFAHLRDGEGAEAQFEAVRDRFAAAALEIALLECCQPAAAILAHRLDERQARAASRAPA